MVVKSQIKLIKSLQQKKYRNEHGLFVVEGKKAILELLASTIKVFKIYTTQDEVLDCDSNLVEMVSRNELKQMSSLKNPNTILGVFYISTSDKVDEKGWVLALDEVQDPGNMGTIIRLCDWFGIKHLICSLGTVDCYNPKVLQATMGSISRVNIVYSNLGRFLNRTNLPVYGTFMEGDNLGNVNFPSEGVIVLGNEGKGISEDIKLYCSNKVAIPQFGGNTTESLNVATATAIILNEVRRG